MGDGNSRGEARKSRENNRKCALHFGRRMLQEVVLGLNVLIVIQELEASYGSWWWW